MSLVDYASSSSEEDDEAEEMEAKPEEEDKDEKNPSHLLPSPSPPTKVALASSPQPLENIATSSAPPSEKLPDASLLLESPSLPSYNSVSVGGHSSIIAAARAENLSRKRESNGSAFSHPQNKLPRRNAPNSKNVQDTEGGMLLPPQVNGRSNVVTEDIGRLFVNRRTNASH